MCISALLTSSSVSRRRVIGMLRPKMRIFACVSGLMWMSDAPSRCACTISASISWPMMVWFSPGQYSSFAGMERPVLTTISVSGLDVEDAEVVHRITIGPV